MKTKYVIYFAPVVILILFSTPGISQVKQSGVIIDPVCGKKVDLNESYKWKYAGKVYYFDTYVCRYSFKMNPQGFLTKSCIPDLISIDPVCGMKVNKSESYNRKYKNIKYHFCSYDCRETFKMDPEKFINNKCVVPDSTEIMK